MKKQILLLQVTLTSIDQLSIPTWFFTWQKLFFLCIERVQTMDKRVSLLRFFSNEFSWKFGPEIEHDKQCKSNHFQFSRRLNEHRFQVGSKKQMEKSNGDICFALWQIIRINSSVFIVRLIDRRATEWASRRINCPWEDWFGNERKTTSARLDKSTFPTNIDKSPALQKIIRSLSSADKLPLIDTKTTSPLTLLQFVSFQFPTQWNVDLINVSPTRIFVTFLLGWRLQLRSLIKLDRAAWSPPPLKNLSTHRWNFIKEFVRKDKSKFCRTGQSNPCR